LERAVKATFLYKFVPFVGWPAGAFETPESPVNICVAGDDPFGPLLDETLAGQTAGVRQFALHRLEAVPDEGTCHVMFVSGTMTEAILDAVRGRPVLTVTDAATDGDAIGIIHFIEENERVGFDIDMVEAANNNVSISARLLALARTVRTPE
jgi:hypothetical protein